MLDFRLLGPLEVNTPDSGGPVRGPAQKVLLLTLLLNANRWVQAESLKYELWRSSWPASPGNALHAQVSRLRRRLECLEPDRPAPRLLAERTRYQLLATESEIDGQRFSSRLRGLRQQAEVMPPRQLALSLREALSAWRGPVFGGVEGGSICAAGRRSYETVRHEALELLFDAELRSGRHARSIVELMPLVTSYSSSLDRFTEQLMVALYRCGRQVEALEVHRRTKQLLLTHSVQPSKRLVNCEQAILAQDSLLSGESAERPAA